MKQRFDRVIDDRIDPKFASRAQQITDSIRAVFSKEFVDGVVGDLPISDARDVTVVKAPESVFARRLRQIRERAERTDVYQKLQGQFTALRDKVRASPVYQKGVEVQNRVGDRIEDARDAYETTQNPIVLTMRDAGDSMFSESDQAAAMAALRRLDPNFSLADLMEELEHYMIPAVVKAYLRADTAVLRDVCGGDALTFVNASVRQRQAQNAHYDERILDVRNIAFHDAITLESGEPVLVVTFTCQHVHCVRGPDGVILEGSDRDIRTTIYSWALARDHASEMFNWRILDMQVQGIRALI